ncbi:MAG: hypothetical protein Q8S73_11145 [Deltaproteobacteria bacterium]|nr:hypothetical protein [Myxococcales bacterium]MDP3214652.1 hypothetical protein [Deltaproteobacteria bacterium]
MGIAHRVPLYELDRTRADKIGFAVVDRGMWPADDLRHAFPLPTPSALEDAIDRRRVRALMIDTLERASKEGHTLLPSDWVIRRVRDAALSPPCPLDEDTLSMVGEALRPFVTTCALADGSPAYQLDRYSASQRVIRKPILDRAGGARAKVSHPWRELIDGAFGS